MTAAVPRFHTRIMIVASKSWISNNAKDVMAATASPPAMLLVLLCRGAGALSVDHLLWRRLFRSPTLPGDL